LIALKGKVKGETSERDHLFPCVHCTQSGINVFKWLKMLRLAHEIRGRRGWTAITSWEGKILSSATLDGLLHYYLIEMLENKQEFPFEIQSDDDICERFLVYRSLRRGSTMRAINQGISQNDINIMNR